MTENLATSIQSVNQVALPLTVLIVVLITGYVARRFLFRQLTRWAQHTQFQLDDIVIASAKGPFVIWFLMLGIYLAVKFSNLPEDVVNIVGKILFVLGLFSVTLVLANISSRVIGLYSSRLKVALPGASLTQNIARIVILGIGILVILNGLGIPITPILATLGVGGLAVALALQDTLSNLFAGFYILVARQIKVGDYIKLDSGEEGYVTDITWRTTKIKMLPNNVVLVPNEKLKEKILSTVAYGGQK
jgi:small-conductance mechanosensitive channel